MAKISGGSVLSLQRFLLARSGADAFERVLSAMPVEDAEPLRGIVLPVRWYPVFAFVRAIETAAALFGNEVYEDYGRFAAEFETNAFQKVALRFTSPTYLLDRAGRMWHRFHDTGDWVVTGGGKQLHGELRGFAVISPGYCRVLTAWIGRACEMTGVRGTVHHPHCRARGAEACVFEGRWD